MDKPLSFYAFEMLYWCGIREGELLALTPADFDFESSTVSINKSYQRLNGKDVITTPKTKKSNRVIKMPQFLCDEMKEYIKMFYSAADEDRIFPITKHYLKHEMERGCKATGVKRMFCRQSCTQTSEIAPCRMRSARTSSTTTCTSFISLL
jgi:integrase